MVIQRIKVFPALQYAFQKVWEDRYFLLKVSWVCLLLEIVFSLLLDESLKDSPLNVDIEAEFLVVPFKMPYENLLFYVISIIFGSIAFVRYYQFLLASDDDLGRELSNIPINSDRNINLPYYFELNKNIISYALFTFLFFSIFIILENNFLLVYFTTFPSDLYDHGTYYTAIKYYIFSRLFAHNPLEILLVALFIFFWPYLAVRSQYFIKDLKSLFAATKGNLLPVFIVIYLLTMVPGIYFFLTEHIQVYLHSEGYSMDTLRDVSYFFYVLSFPIDYVIVFTQIAFISLIYKKLAVEGKKL